jgi:hypothetical protein
MEKKKCLGCGLEFAPARWWQEFCCAKHRQDFHNNQYRSNGVGPFAPRNERNITANGGTNGRAVGKKLTLADLGFAAAPTVQPKRRKLERSGTYYVEVK